MNRRLVLCTIVIISLFTIFSFEGTESRHVKAKSGDGARVVELASNATVSCAPPCDEGSSCVECLRLLSPSRA
ncbi:hypothetical protein QR680_006117 [Steinernema hermaphroditum]|uniref:Secreted protein n=1 Tax=Steinernema hermaphroditum TaxID=289476 RepID=A0AA39HVR3_9BILA|nr:hypothetical protein QR680_006117 [Steinernema hermaphroditum]